MKKKTGENICEWVKAILTAGISAVIVLQFILPTAVFGISMEPSFEHRDYLLINRQAYKNGRTPQRGDVIVFQSHLRDTENGGMKNLIKRVIAVPGDTVAVDSGKVYINGEVLEESYIKDGITNGEVPEVTVPSGNYFCMGDNRLHSTDSRFLEVGFIEEKAIIGEVFFRIFPFNKIGLIGS